MATSAMSNLEELVYGWLTRRNIKFSFQTSLSGGFFQLGGAVVDFIIGNLAWRVQGEYYHKGVVKEGSDLLQREILAGMGYIVVDLWGDDLEDPARREEVLIKALRGEEALR